MNWQKQKPILGVSACLLGENVRYNAGHKLNRYLTKELQPYFEYKGICPEVEIGLPTPRPAIRMVEFQDKLIVTTSDKQTKITSSSIDYADELAQVANTFSSVLDTLSGYVFMQKSPSCGVGSSKVYLENGYPQKQANGAYANEVIKRYPNLPVIDAGKLNDAVLREHFLTQVYAYHEWQTKVLPNLTFNRLLDFHRRHKLQLRIHHEPTMRKLGPMLSDVRKLELQSFAQFYISEFMAALSKPARRPQQANLLYRMEKFLKNTLSPEEKREVIQQIDEYREGRVPMVVPMTLIKFFIKQYRCNCDVAALNPYPEQLGLRNGI